MYQSLCGYNGWSQQNTTFVYLRVYRDIVTLDLSIKLPKHHDVILSLIQRRTELCVSILQGLRGEYYNAGELNHAQESCYRY